MRPLHPETLAWFDRHSWPGNIRELENLVHQAFLLTEGESIRIAPPRELAEEAAGVAAPCAGPLSYRHAKDRAITEFETRFLSDAMQRTQGNVTAAARLIGTERRHLGRLLKKYRIPTQA